MKSIYLLINIFVIAGPLALSFDKKVAFFKKFKTIAWSIFIPSFIYLVWDIIFTNIGVWSFNFDYLMGPKLFGLPFEEYLFFFTVPYACLFVYACIRYYFPKFSFPVWAKLFTGILITVLTVILFFNYEKLYTAVTALLLWFTLMNLIISKCAYLTHLLLAWIIAFIPMAIVNGILTAKPVVIYNNFQNLNIRIGTIPIEDFFYNLLLMCWIIILYEKGLFAKSKRALKRANKEKEE